MSRSYKKNPYDTDHRRKTTKESKRLANRTFRHKIHMEEDMAARPKHRKYTQTYDICDWRNRWAKEEAIEWYIHLPDSSYTKKRYPTLERFVNYWEKCCRRK